MKVITVNVYQVKPNIFFSGKDAPLPMMTNLWSNTQNNTVILSFVYYDYSSRSGHQKNPFVSVCRGLPAAWPRPPGRTPSMWRWCRQLSSLPGYGSRFWTGGMAPSWCGTGCIPATPTCTSTSCWGTNTSRRRRTFSRVEHGSILCVCVFGVGVKCVSNSPD